MKKEKTKKDAKEKLKSKSAFQSVKNLIFRKKANQEEIKPSDEKVNKKKNKKKNNLDKKKKDKNTDVVAVTVKIGAELQENTEEKVVTIAEKKELKDNKPEAKKDFNITEIFYSIQGESTFAGLPCVFVRLQGCNLRCTWCDTEYALSVKKERKPMSADDILAKLKKYECKYVCITGGEPLMQKRVPELLSILCNNGYTVALETNGHYSLKDIDKRVSKIVDFKCPGSKMEKKNNLDNIQYLTRKDEVKFVIKDKEDYKWMKDIILKNNLSDKVNTVLLSPVFGKLEPKQLSKWILKDNLKARVQLQVHKYIWNPKKRGV